MNDRIKKGSKLIRTTYKDELERRFPLEPCSSVMLTWNEEKERWERTEDLQFCEVTTKKFTDYTGQYTYTLFCTETDYYLHMERAPLARGWKLRKAMDLIHKELNFFYVPTGWKVAIFFAVLALYEGLMLYSLKIGG